MTWKSALCYARFWLVLALVSGQLTEEQKEQILDFHNWFRSIVSPEAADMLHMTWNETLVEVAQRYAARCIWKHNDDVQDTLGENLFLTTGPLNINKSLTNWFNEHIHYDYTTDTCDDGMCGHYTQMVWAKTSSIGCASHFCQTVQEEDYDKATILVCNYFPQGNIEGQKPYEAGEPCSKCPQEVLGCLENTCFKTENPTEESFTDTWPTDRLQTEPTSSVRFTECSVATLLLAGLMVYFIF